MSDILTAVERGFARGLVILTATAAVVWLIDRAFGRRG